MPEVQNLCQRRVAYAHSIWLRCARLTPGVPVRRHTATRDGTLINSMVSFFIARKAMPELENLC